MPGTVVMIFTRQVSQHFHLSGYLEILWVSAGYGAIFVIIFKVQYSHAISLFSPPYILHPLLICVSVSEFSAFLILLVH